MIASSPTAKVLSLILATTLMVGSVRLAVPETSIEVEGGGQAAAARMGSTFEDMAIGTLSADPVNDQTPEVTVPEQTKPPTVSETRPTEPTAAEALQVTAAPSPAQSLTSTPALASTTFTPVPPILAAIAVSPAPSPSITRRVQQETPAANPTTIVTSQYPVTSAPPHSSRPKRRDPKLAAKAVTERPKPDQAKAKPKVTKPKSKHGNAKRDNTKGAVNGTSRQAKAKTQGTARKASAQSGNAAASNYPGQVMRRISRVPKPRVNSRGTAVIRFSISANGGLGRVSVARSSGSAALDKAAIAVIRKAGPFPPPPRGAQRQFSIRIKRR